MTDRPASAKSEDAYRTISEVAAELDLPQHVLRFWETRFPQVKPLKRAGGRRFYRPEDVALLRAVRVLLYDEGYTIKGVQRLLSDHGARHVADALARSRAAAPPEREGRRGGGSPAPAPGVPILPHAPHTPPVPPAPSAPPVPPIPPMSKQRPTAGTAARPELGIASPEPAAAQGFEPSATFEVGRGRAVGAADEQSVAGQLSAVLADLSECARLLASLRST